MQKIIKHYVLSLISILLLIISFNISFSFFSTRIAGTPKSVNVNTKPINIIFPDSDDLLMESNMLSSWTDTMNFTITNNSNTVYEYSIVIKNLINTFTGNSIQYKLQCTSSNFTSSYFTNMTEYANINQVMQKSDYTLGYRIAIDAGETQNFILYFRYNPSANLEKGPVIQGRVSILPGNSENYMMNLNVTKGSDVFGTSKSVFSGNNASIGIDKSGYNFTNAILSGTGCSFDAERNNVIVTNVTSNITCNITGLTPINYTIVYDSNLGSGTMNSTSCTYNQNCTLRANSFTREGYVFYGWKDSNNNVYSDSSSVKSLGTTDGQNVTLIAQWSPIEYTISYSCNGKLGSIANSIHKYGVLKQLNESTCVAGQITTGISGNVSVFLGWSTSSTATTAAYTDRQSVMNLTNVANSEVKLYAVYSNLFAYGGLYQVYDDSNGNWRVKLYGNSSTRSGTYNLSFAKPLDIDIFLVGGGGGGGGNGDYGSAGGGGGGYTKTVSNVSVANTSYSVTIAAGGGPLARGGTTSFVYSSSITYSASGGYPGSQYYGGNGGSGGGRGPYPGGTQGGNGSGTASYGYGQIAVSGSYGETGNTSEFGEASSYYYLIYSGGGGGYGNGTGGLYGGGNGGWTGSNGIANTGGGGGAGYYTTIGGIGSGGSGVVVIRNHR